MKPSNDLRERVWMEMLEGRLLLSLSGDVGSDPAAAETLPQDQITEFSDEYGNSPTNATPIALDHDVEGGIDYAEDQDVFSIEAQEGQTYTLCLSRLNYGWGDLKWRRQHFTPAQFLHLNIFDRQDAELASVQSN